MENQEKQCLCHSCIEEYNICDPLMPGVKINITRMILCEICGNKRCPHATNHRLPCTNSNELNQKGSIYSNDH